MPHGWTWLNTRHSAEDDLRLDGPPGILIRLPAFLIPIGHAAAYAVCGSPHSHFCNALGGQAGGLVQAARQQDVPCMGVRLPHDHSAPALQPAVRHAVVLYCLLPCGPSTRAWQARHLHIVSSWDLHCTKTAGAVCQDPKVNLSLQC